MSYPDCSHHREASSGKAAALCITRAATACRERGNNHNIIFADNSVYLRYLDILAGACDRYGLHPEDCRWSSFHYNALGMTDTLMTQHEIYQAPGPDDTLRQQRYLALFDHCIGQTDINGIREATSKYWLLDSDRYKEEIKLLLSRQLEPKCRGGDRKSDDFRNPALNKINRV